MVGPDVDGRTYDEWLELAQTNAHLPELARLAGHSGWEMPTQGPDGSVHWSRHDTLIQHDVHAVWLKVMKSRTPRRRAHERDAESALARRAVERKPRARGTTRTKWTCMGSKPDAPCTSTTPRTPGASTCDACHSRMKRERAATELDYAARLLANTRVRLLGADVDELARGILAGLADEQLGESADWEVSPQQLAAVRDHGASVAYDGSAAFAARLAKPKPIARVSAQNQAALCELVKAAAVPDAATALHKAGLRPPGGVTILPPRRLPRVPPHRGLERDTVKLPVSPEQATELGALQARLQAEVGHIEPTYLAIQCELASLDRDDLHAVCTREALVNIADEFARSEDWADARLADRAAAALVMFDDISGYDADYVVERIEKVTRSQRHAAWVQLDKPEPSFLRAMAGMRLVIGRQDYRWWSKVYSGDERLVFRGRSAGTKQEAKRAAYDAAVTHLQAIAQLCDVPWDGVDEAEVEWQASAHRPRKQTRTKARRVEEPSDRERYDSE